jgi:hypothetical protein
MGQQWAPKFVIFKRLTWLSGKRGSVNLHPCAVEKSKIIYSPFHQTLETEKYKK